MVTALPAMPAYARSHHSEAWARDRFAAAERMREALNGRPPAERMRRDYQRVLNAYRNVYYGAPSSTKADPSVVAVAETLVEMGRRFDDDTILKEAVAQYKFLRKEYPGSRYRCDALFTIGEIYKDDLDDPEQARATFEEFLKRYPHNRLVEDAQQAILELKKESLEKRAEAEKDAQSEKKAEAKFGGGIGDKATKAATPAQTASLPQPETKETSSRNESANSEDSESHSHLPRVTAIRHWSTPDYTRVAIDLESEVKFGSQRISNPDRIFFDLRDTKLASTLVGKTFDVDDGFLKKIRVAEFQPGRTRVVLEVDDLASYNAFLLPDPYRLIIDIHGKQSRAALMANVHPETDPVAAPDDTVDAPSPTQKADPKTAEKAEKSTSVHFSKAPKEDREAVVEADLPPTAADSTTEANGVGVLKTKVTVPGTHRKIPKTIVQADDQAPTTVATLEPEELRPEVTPAQRAKAEEESVKPDRASAKSSRKKKAKISAATEADTADLKVHEAQPTAAGDRSLIRALGLKIGKIVIDPGHGGHDTGTIGPNGLLEKDLVLDVAKRLGRLLESRLGAEVVYTRQDDTFIPLETRTAIANQERADLFISIHANSSHDPDARGVETYYLNFTSSADALEVAARENAVSQKSVYELQDLVKKIALKEKIEESHEFASDVQQSLYGGLRSSGVRNRGVKKAPFIVLIGANMPSILAEISFVSNPTDARKLKTAEQRQRIAEALYRGVSKYANGLSGVKVASKIDKGEGQ